MQFEMPVLLAGAMSFLPDNGNRINQLYVLNSDESNTMYKGLVPAKMSCDQEVFNLLSQKIDDFPQQATLVVKNKTSGGKTVQHAIGIKMPSPKK